MRQAAHRPDCSGYQDMTECNQVCLKTVDVAEAAGYKRAGNCPAEEEAQMVATRPAASTVSEAKSAPASTASTPAAASVSTTGEVIGNKNSKKYHLQGCPGYSQVGEKNRVMFKSAAEAEAAGYMKAGNCKK
jgi:hypothetical protein